MNSVYAHFQMKFLYVDEYNFSERWFFEKKTVPYCMYRYIISGSAVFIVDGQNYRVQQNDVFYIPSGCTLECHASESISFISVRFVNSMDIYGENLLKELFEIPMLNPNAGTNVGQYFHLIYECAISKQHTKQLRIQAYLSLITAVLSEAAGLIKTEVPKQEEVEDRFAIEQLLRRAQKSAIHQNPKITMVVDYMLTHPQETPTVTYLSQMTGMSESTFRRLFKEQTGKAPVDFMKDFRMMNAARRLLTSDETVTEIAYSVGYDEPNYFSRCFRQVFGISPQEYRKRSQML